MNFIYCIQELVADFSQQRPGFDLWLVHVRFLVETMIQGRGFFFLSAVVFPTVLHICIRKPTGQFQGMFKQCNGFWVLDKKGTVCCVQAKENVKSQ